MGCGTLDEKERAWIFQPSDRSWGSSAELAQGMDDVWIDFHSKVTGAPARLHGLWLASARRPSDGPVLLYLHGARWNVEGLSPRIHRMQELGFSVLAIDYRGFARARPGCPPKTWPTRTRVPPGIGWRQGIRPGRATSSAIRWVARLR